MPRYINQPDYRHGTPEDLGILLVNLGTPDDPSPAAVRRYLAEFLWDPRVIELPRPLWWLVLHGVILRVRPKKSAHAYQQIWTPEGSPLLVHSRAIATSLERRLGATLHRPVAVELGMSYGNPSIPDALARLRARNVRRLLVLPLYPQYSGTTTASIFDRVTAELSRWRWIPELRFVAQYHDEQGYIAALAASIREHWDRNGRRDHLLFSFHGIPRQCLLDGDPYHCQCHKTARLAAEALGLGHGEWSIAFQSRVGSAEWLRPYTDELLTQYAASGPKRLTVACPGFAVDCLETIEEMGLRNRDAFLAAGGESYDFVPCLNDRPDHVDFLAGLATRHCGGWPETGPARDSAALHAAAEASRARARAAGASH
jgi:ferrochelatase